MAKKPAKPKAEKKIEAAAAKASGPARMRRGNRIVDVPQEEVAAFRGGGWRKAQDGA